MQKKSVMLLVAALIVIGAVAFAISKRAPAPEASGTEVATTMPANETPAADGAPTDAAIADVPPQPAADATAPADAAAAPADQAAATDGEGSLLAAPTSLQIDVPKIMQDRVLGKAEAPVTIIEYASLTCPHCANFNNNTMPQVKKQLIETGRAKLIFREFPLNAPAIKASMLARCAPEDKYYDILDVLFKNQERWMESDDIQKSLTQYGTLAGMDEDYIKACLSNEELETAIVKNMQDAQAKYSVKATPTFILNEGAKRLTGADGVDAFSTAIDQIAEGK